jgi:hypothetical protein
MYIFIEDMVFSTPFYISNADQEGAREMPKMGIDHRASLNVIR